MPKPNRIAIILLLMTLVVVSRAQIFPVHVTTQITPPYSPYLYDYVSPGSQRLMVQIRINDLQLSDYNVKLRVTIEGLGITIRTSQHYAPPPLMLGDPGVPTILWGDDLAPYFDINNLDFSGFSKSEFQRTGKLPEGVYRLTVEALDYNRGTTVSNKGTTVVWMIMNDPPLLNLPRKDSKTKIVDPTNIVFTWTPRHTASPNAAFTTDYIFRLVEIWPADRNPYDAFLTQLPLYEVTTNQSQIVYGVAEPALIPGRRYAWQVQAVDGEGKDLFRNQGRSEVYVFQFGDVVTTPANFRKENASVSSLSVRWEPSSIGDMPDQYRLRYKTTGSERWTEMTTTQSWANINQLTTNASYDLQVRAEKGNQLSEYTTTLKASTLATPPENNFRCGDPANIEAPKTNTPVLLTLTPGDIVTCADFSAVVTEVTRSLNGSFSGKALMKVKMLNGASIEVTFSGNINNAYQFTSGGFVSTYEAGSEITQIIDDAYTIGEEKPEEPPTDTLQNQGTTILIDGVIDTVFVNGDGQIVVIDEDGNRDEFDQKKDKDGNVIGETVITGSDGESVVVGTDGEVKEGPSTALPDAIASASAIDYSVSFEPHAMQHYGFDQKTTFGDYETIKVGGKDYTVAWKSIESGRQDKITALTTKDKFPEAIGFKTLTAPTPSQASDNNSRKELWLTGLSDGQTEYVSAYVRVKDSKDAEPKDVEVGRVNIQTYNKISNYVYIVPVNGAEVPANLATTLNTIYRQAVVGWSVTVEPTFTIDQSYINGLDSEPSDWLSAFPDKMKEFQKQYKQSHNIDHDAYYIFLIKGKAFSSSGFMPFKRKYGYIFVDNTKDVTTTIAHELGHGAFRLRHTFSSDAFLAPERSTDNLMDYNNGTALKKFQWDLVRNPEAMVSWLEEDEESEYYSKERMINFLKVVKGNNEKFFEKSDPQAQAYLTANVVSEQDLLDQKVIDLMASLPLYQFYDPKDPIIQAFIKLVDGSKPDDPWKTFIKKQPTPVPHDENAILLAKEMDVDLDNTSFTLSMHGYGLSEKSITLYAKETTLTDGVQFTFFNAAIAKSGDENDQNEKDATNIRKAFDIIVHSKNHEAFKEYLKIKGTINVQDENPESEEIIIDVIRKKSNKYITIGEISVRGTNLKGATLELGKGTDAESKTSCTDKRSECYECKRIPTGDFKFDINTLTSQQGQHKYKTLRVLNTMVNGSNRDGILVHMGDSYSWTQGCVLAMYDNEIETIIEDDTNIDENIMGFGNLIDERNASRTFILSIIEFIEEKERKIGKPLTKKIYISDDPVENNLELNTASFDLLQKANQFYFSNNLFDKSTNQFKTFAASLFENIVTQKLESEISTHADKIIAKLDTEIFSHQQSEHYLDSIWISLLKKNQSTLDVNAFVSVSISNLENFKTHLRSYLQTIVNDNSIMDVMFNANKSTSLNKHIFKTYASMDDKNPGLPKRFCTQEVLDGAIANARINLMEEQLSRIQNYRDSKKASK